MKPGARKVFAVAATICFGIFLSGNWFLAGISLGRFDLTEGHVYTISESSKKIFQDLKAPVNVKFYVSPADKMPTGMKTLEQDVIDKLEEMRVVSKGHFQYKVFHMEAANITQSQDSNKTDGESLEEQLQKKGIQPFQVQAIESDEVAVRLIYASMTIAYKEKSEEIIPQIIPSNLHELEYMVVSKVFRMTLSAPPRVALVAPYQEGELDPQVAGLLKQMGGSIPQDIREDQYELLEMALRYEGYEVTRLKSISQDQPIPEGIKTLILIEPSNFNDRQRYEINRFLYQGGSVFLAVQNYFYNYEMGGSNLKIIPEKKNPDLNLLLSEWGFEVDEYILVDEQHDVINISGGARMGPFQLSVPIKLPIQILVSSDGMNPDLSVTSRLSPIFYLWGTAVKVFEETVKKNGIQVQTLLSSSKASWTVPPQEQNLMPRHLFKQPESRLGPFPLAILAQGQFPDIWKDRDVPAWPETPDEKLGHSSLTAAPGKMILVGAAMPFQKNLFRGGGHVNFFMNSIDALTLGDQLISIRSKQLIDRTLSRVSAPTKIMWRVLVSFLIPAILAFLGFFRSMARRQAKQQYLKDFAAIS